MDGTGPTLRISCSGGPSGRSRLHRGSLPAERRPRPARSSGSRKRPASWVSTTYPAARLQESAAAVDRIRSRTPRAHLWPDTSSLSSGTPPHRKRVPVVPTDIGTAATSRARRGSRGGIRLLHLAFVLHRARADGRARNRDLSYTHATPSTPPAKARPGGRLLPAASPACLPPASAAWRADVPAVRQVLIENPLLPTVETAGPSGRRRRRSPGWCARPAPAPA